MTKIVIKKTRNYINNKDMHDALVEYKDRVTKALETNTVKPRIPNYLGECFYKIATRFASKPSFASYSWKEEMIGDAVMNMIQYIDNYNTEYKNPFAYFTQYARNAFIRRINKEKHEQEIKVMNGIRQGLISELDGSPVSFGTEKLEYKEQNVGNSKKSLPKPQKIPKVSILNFVESKE